MQKAKAGTYTGLLDVAGRTMKEGGPLKFYTGFPTYYVRIGPHVTFTLVFLSLIQKVQKDYGL